MGGQTTFSSSSSSSSSSSESSQQGVEKFQHFSLRRPPPPPPTHFRGNVKKHHRHSHFYHPFPQCTSDHRPHQIVEYPLLERPYLHGLPRPMGGPGHHHHKEGKLRVKPLKHLKKVHKLHLKVMKAYKKIPKSARHVARHCHHMYFPPPGIFSASFRHHHPPNCCPPKSEAMMGLSIDRDMSFRHHHHPFGHGRYPPLGCVSRRLPKPDVTKPNVAGDEVASVSPLSMETSAEPPTVGGTMPLTSAMPPAVEPAPFIQAP